MNVIILTAKEALNKILSEHFREQFKAHVYSFLDVQSALNEILQNDQIKLIVIKNNEEDQNFATKVLNQLYDLSRETPVIIIGEYDQSFTNYETIGERLILEELNRVVIKRLKLKREDYAHLKLPDYIPIPVGDLLGLKIVPCDLFIKLNKKEGEDYLKRFKQNDDFSEDDIKTYREAGVTHLFVRKDERDVFYQGFTKDSLVKLRDFPLASVDEKVKITSSIFQTSSHFVRELGLSEATIQVVETSIKSLQQFVTGDKLGNLLKKLLQSEESYSYKRSAMISAISYHVLPEMDWGSGDQLQQIFQKIHTVSFYHDLSLENEEHLKILFKDDFSAQTKLTSKERDIILNHAQKMATLMQGIPKLPQGVDLIVKQHHGQSNGIGFPDKLTSSISPLAIFFIVVEHFVTLLLEYKEKINFELIFDELYRVHTLPSYRKVVDALRVKFASTYRPN